MKATFRFAGGRELAENLRRLPERVSTNIQRQALRDAAEPMRREMAALAPHEPGAPDLRESMSISNVRTGTDLLYASEVAVAVGPSKDAFYGCVFGGMTWVSTERGQRAICQIKVGDKVLTQTGEFRPVTATYRYPATEKPDLVTITSHYRADRSHRLTLTLDHKVLVDRSGKFQWVKAGDLVAGDTLSHRRKLSWSKGTAVVEARSCEGCGRAYTKRARLRQAQPAGFSTGNRFCSHTCRAKWLTTRHVGMKRSQASKERMSRAAIDRLARHPELHPNRIMSAKGYETDHEKLVADWLITRGIAFHPQHKIGQSFVDFYLPETNTVIEADGAFWHQDQQRDIDRDKGLLEVQPDLRIIHMHFADARFTPQLDRQPLPNVVYVPCNPGPSSFVDPGMFEASTVLSVEHWRYEQTSKRPVLLYDISVDGIHSFVASGIVIHNSFQEFGTVHHGAQPFARPAFDQNIQRSLAILAKALWAAIAKRRGPVTGIQSGPGRNL